MSANLADLNQSGPKQQRKRQSHLGTPHHNLVILHKTTAITLH